MLSMHSHVTLELRFHISNSRGKIVQNVNFLSINQNSDLNSKLNPTREYESRGMLGFQNRVLDIKILQFHVNQDNSAYLKKYDFSTEARFPILRLPLYSWCRNESKSGLGSWFHNLVGLLYKMRQTLTDIFMSLSRKMWLFANDFKHRKNIYQIEACEEMSHLVLVSSFENDQWQRK